MIEMPKIFPLALMRANSPAKRSEEMPGLPSAVHRLHLVHTFCPDRSRRQRLWQGPHTNRALLFNEQLMADWSAGNRPKHPRQKSVESAMRNWHNGEILIPRPQQFTSGRRDSLTRS
jgi:hypothetical protein